MPIILKGIATPEDAIIAYEAGVQGIVLSNHGGRQLDTARSGLENLVEIVAALKQRGPWPNPNFSIFIDGGVRRASDVLKALALGASAVGVGRGFLSASLRRSAPPAAFATLPPFATFAALASLARPLHLLEQLVQDKMQPDEVRLGMVHLP